MPKSKQSKPTIKARYAKDAVVRKKAAEKIKKGEKPSKALKEADNRNYSAERAGARIINKGKSRPKIGAMQMAKGGMVKKKNAC